MTDLGKLDREKRASLFPLPMARARNSRIFIKSGTDSSLNCDENDFFKYVKRSVVVTNKMESYLLNVKGKGRVSSIICPDCTDCVLLTQIDGVKRKYQLKTLKNERCVIGFLNCQMPIDSEETEEMENYGFDKRAKKNFPQQLPCLTIPSVAEIMADNGNLIEFQKSCIINIVPINLEQKNSSKQCGINYELESSFLIDNTVKKILKSLPKSK